MEKKKVYQVPQVEVELMSEHCIIFMSENDNGADNFGKDIFES